MATIQERLRLRFFVHDAEQSQRCEKETPNIQGDNRESPSIVFRLAARTRTDVQLLTYAIRSINLLLKVMWLRGRWHNSSQLEWLTKNQYMLSVRFRAQLAITARPLSIRTCRTCLKTAVGQSQSLRCELFPNGHSSLAEMSLWLRADILSKNSIFGVDCFFNNHFQNSPAKEHTRWQTSWSYCVYRSTTNRYWWQRISVLSLNFLSASLKA